MKAPHAKRCTSGICFCLPAHISTEGQCADAGKALAAITNAQLRSESPDAASMLSLVCHCVRSPEQHGAGKWWGAQHAPGAGQLSASMRLAVFGHALQLVVEDLLTGSTEVRSMQVAHVQ